MRVNRTVRPIAIALALGVLLGIAGCSSDGGDGSAGGGSTKDYCEAIEGMYELAAQSAPNPMPPDDIERTGELMREAASAAPPDVQRDLSASFLGDSYALDDLGQYNEENCDIEEWTSTP